MKISGLTILGKGKTMKIRTICTAALVVGLVACGSTPEEEAQSGAVKGKVKLPQWVINPTIVNGFAATECTEASADFAILKSKTETMARGNIARQIGVKVQAMDKLYSRLTEVEEGNVSASTFEKVEKQLTQQSIQGSRTTQVDYVDFPDGKQRICSKVELNPELTKKLFDNIVKTSERKVSAQNENVLYEEFKSHKAQQELDREMEKLDS